MTSVPPPRLARRHTSRSGDRPPARIVHIGLGAFHRSHQAWYTSHAPDAAEWGIAAFTGRSDDLVEALRPQEGLYTLTERGPESDRTEIIDSIVEVCSGRDAAALIDAISRPEVVIVTLTITEAGYRIDRSGRLDLTDPTVLADIDALRDGTPPTTAVGRLLAGLIRRRRAGAPPIAVVPCDNLPANGAVVRGVLEDLAAHVDSELVDGLADGIRVVSTSVDRITPRTQLAETVVSVDGVDWIDAAPVLAEPFADWVLSGEFPGGRPAWEKAGARFVDDVEPWERRKLWLLNGAHTILAGLGPLRGHATVSAAVVDPACRAAVEAFWDEAVRHLPDVDADAYRASLLERFANPRIEHLLSQIAEDALTKVRLRIVPVAERERVAGRTAAACADAIAACAVASGAADPAALLDSLSRGLCDDAEFAARVASGIRTLTAAAA